MQFEEYVERRFSFFVEDVKGKSSKNTHVSDSSLSIGVYRLKPLLWSNPEVLKPKRKKNERRERIKNQKLGEMQRKKITALHLLKVDGRSHGLSKVRKKNARRFLWEQNLMKCNVVDNGKANCVKKQRRRKATRKYWKTSFNGDQERFTQSQNLGSYLRRAAMVGFRWPVIEQRSLMVASCVDKRCT